MAAGEPAPNDPGEVTQLVFVAVDESDSMTDPFESDSDLNSFSSFSRFDAVRQFLIQFINKGYIFSTGSLYGLISFDHRVRVRSELTPLVSQFEDSINLIEPEGATKCFEAMKIAADRLIEAKPKYPNAKLRIIMISDGRDTRTRRKVIMDLPNYLVSNEIRVDTIIVSDDIERRLYAITKWTGGVIFCPKTVQEGLSIFESEAFFNLQVRKFGPFQPLPITEEMIDQCPHRGRIDMDKFIPTVGRNDSGDKEVVVTLSYIDKRYGDREGLSRTKRLLIELRNLLKSSDRLIKVFPFKEKLDQWRVLLSCPPGSAYSERWWYLTISFPSEYPKAPPLVRFIGPPFHPNVSSEGRVCVSTLSNQYDEKISIRDILISIQSLLLAPNYDEPIDVFHRDLIESDRDLFEQNIVESIAKNSKKTQEEWTQDWNIEDSPQDIEVEESYDYVPANLKCPMTGKLMRNPVKSTTGYYFEQAALSEYVTKSKNPVCPLTGKPFDKVKDADPQIDEQMREYINSWRESQKG